MWEQWILTLLNCELEGYKTDHFEFWHKKSNLNRILILQLIIGVRHLVGKGDSWAGSFILQIWRQRTTTIKVHETNETSGTANQHLQISGFSLLTPLFWAFFLPNIFTRSKICPVSNLKLLKNLHYVP